MAQSKLYPVVMAGGSGSRLWPLSRVLYPKQFLCLKGDLTMLQTTICRLNGVECESPVVICNEQHRSPRTLFSNRRGVTPHLPLRWRRWRQNVIARRTTH